MAAMQKAAASALRAAARPTLSRRIPILARHESTAATDIPHPPVPLSGVMFRGEETYLEEAMRTRDPDYTVARDNPDYTVAIDYRTSNFSPVPIRVMDGSEPGETTPAAVLSGAPIELQGRTVRIYKATKPATQSGNWKSEHWRMDWDVMPKGHRWENPLIGWQSSADFMQGTHLSFKSREDAIRFANKQGYEYFVQEPNERRIIPKAYADQFVHIAKPLKQIRTK